MIIHLNRDKAISTMLLLSMFFVSLTGIVFASQYIFTRGLVSVVFILSRFIFLFLGFLLVATNKINKNWLYFIFIYLFLVLISGAIFYDNIPYVTVTIQKFIPMAFTTIMIFKIKNYEFFLDLFYKISVFVTFIVSSFIFYLLKSGKIILFASADTYMLFSYSILPFTCCLLYSFLKKKSIFNLICFIVCSFFMTIFGCRGAILSLIIYFILLFLQKNIIERRLLRLVTFFSFVLFIFVILYSNLKDINMFLRNEFDIHSRLLKKLSTSQDLNSTTSGRLNIYLKVIKQIEQTPLSIGGINGDSALIGGYCHNIFLELIYDFGLLIGSTFCLIIVCLIFKTIFLTHASALNDLILLFFAFGFIKLLVSSSLFYETYIWCWFILGLKNCKITRSILCKK